MFALHGHIDERPLLVINDLVKTESVPSRVGVAVTAEIAMIDVGDRGHTSGHEADGYVLGCDTELLGHSVRELLCASHGESLAVWSDVVADGSGRAGLRSQAA
jgi:hypothetical protein